MLKKCNFCGVEGETATRENLRGLCLLSPDEKWICDICLKIKIKNIAYVQ